MPQTRLTPKQVREIRRRYKAGELQKKLADRFKISQTAISFLLAGKTYRRVA